jgi:hypothetical protein
MFNHKQALPVSEVLQQDGSPDTGSLRVLLIQLIQASCKAAFDRVPVAIIDRIITCCALFALVTPLLLWVSWTKTGLFIVIGAASTCVGLIWLLSGCTRKIH